MTHVLSNSLIEQFLFVAIEASVRHCSDQYYNYHYHVYLRLLYRSVSQMNKCCFCFCTINILTDIFVVSDTDHRRLFVESTKRVEPYDTHMTKMSADRSRRTSYSFV